MDRLRDPPESTAPRGQGVLHPHGRACFNSASNDAAGLQHPQAGGQRLRTEATRSVLQLAKTQRAILEQPEDQSVPGAAQDLDGPLKGTAVQVDRLRHLTLNASAYASQMEVTCFWKPGGEKVRSFKAKRLSR
jgi:hypothetical protein